MQKHEFVKAYEIFNQTYPLSKYAFKAKAYREMRIRGIPTGYANKKPRRDAWTQEEIDYLKEVFKNRTYTTATIEFRKKYSNRTVNSVRTKAKELLLKSSPEALEKQKQEFIERSKPTRFKKGQRAINHEEVGTVKFRHHNKSTSYFWIKTQDTGQPRYDWEPCQRYFYKKYHGEIPKGYKVVFLDGDQSNFSKENLMLATNEEFGHARKYFKEKDIEQSRAGVLISRIELAIKELEKNR